MRGSVRVGSHSHEHVDGAGTHLLSIEADRGERGPDERAHRDVIDPDDREPRVRSMTPALIAIAMDEAAHADSTVIVEPLDT